MGRARQPVDLIVAKGASHKGKAELAERKARELKVDLVDVQVPLYLPKALQPKFEEIAAALLHVGVFTELDEDLLARYLLAENNYLRLTQMLSKAITNGDADTIGKLQRSQNAAFNQCHTCASSLGLTITSRCKLMLPETEKPQRGSKFAKFER